MRISRMVPQGTVYAVDIQPEMLAIIEQQMAEARRQMRSTVSLPVGFARKRARRAACSTT
jgi:hypothetical protein